MSRFEGLSNRDLGGAGNMLLHHPNVRVQATRAGFLDWAIRYTNLGSSVFPCHTVIKGMCTCASATCKSPGKHPRTKSGLLEATTDASQIGEWAQRWPEANVAIRTGEISGIVVIDVDPEWGGNESLQDLMAAHGTLPDGPIATTPRGGTHLYTSLRPPMTARRSPTAPAS
jgi:hypothetical protein